MLTFAEHTQLTENVAATILQQLGGKGKVVAMIGAKHFLDGGKYLTFQYPKAPKNKSNAVKIILNHTDTYDVIFYAIRGTNLNEVSKHDGIGAENLKELFQKETGLYLSLR